ncbi:MAG TPA: glycosyltransferase, partial [Thermoplasmatales archaeon]|nr:glycosyltransferase [Thermoplasmatales archaeon]
AEMIPNARFEIVPTGIDLKRFEEGDGRKIKEKFPDKKIILHVGRVVREKNIELIIKAAPRILKKIDAVFIIVGEGPHKDTLEKMVKEKHLSPHFIFTGFVDDRELMDYYKAADVFAFPSKYETQGLVALEAMAAGVPVVAAREKALPDFIRDGENGYLADANDEMEFAEKVMRAMEERDVVARARKFVMDYSAERMAEKLEEVYEKYGDKMQD